MRENVNFDFLFLDRVQRDPHAMADWIDSIQAKLETAVDAWNLVWEGEATQAELTSALLDLGRIGEQLATAEGFYKSPAS